MQYSHFFEALFSFKPLQELGRGIPARAIAGHDPLWAFNGEIVLNGLTSYAISDLNLAITCRERALCTIRRTVGLWGLVIFDLRHCFAAQSHILCCSLATGHIYYWVVFDSDMSLAEYRSGYVIFGSERLVVVPRLDLEDVRTCIYLHYISL